MSPRRHQRHAAGSPYVRTKVPRIEDTSIASPFEFDLPQLLRRSFGAGSTTSHPSGPAPFHTESPATEARDKDLTRATIPGPSLLLPQDDHDTDVRRPRHALMPPVSGRRLHAFRRKVSFPATGVAPPGAYQIAPCNGSKSTCLEDRPASLLSGTPSNDIYGWAATADKSHGSATVVMRGYKGESPPMPVCNAESPLAPTPITAAMTVMVEHRTVWGEHTDLASAQFPDQHRFFFAFEEDSSHHATLSTTSPTVPSSVTSHTPSPTDMLPQLLWNDALLHPYVDTWKSTVSMGSPSSLYEMLFDSDLNAALPRFQSDVDFSEGDFGSPQRTSFNDSGREGDVEGCLQSPFPFQSEGPPDIFLGEEGATNCGSFDFITENSPLGGAFRGLPPQPHPTWCLNAEDVMLAGRGISPELTASSFSPDEYDILSTPPHKQRLSAHHDMHPLNSEKAYSYDAYERQAGLSTLARCPTHLSAISDSTEFQSISQSRTLTHSITLPPLFPVYSNSLPQYPKPHDIYHASGYPWLRPRCSPKTPPSHFVPLYQPQPKRPIPPIPLSELENFSLPFSPRSDGELGDPPDTASRSRMSGLMDQSVTG